MEKFGGPTIFCQSLQGNCLICKTIQYSLFFSSAFGTNNLHHNHQIPTISVSVQTEPSMVNMNGNSSGTNGLANTAALLGKKLLTEVLKILKLKMTLDDS